MHAKFDTYQEVTDAILAQLEAGTAPWRAGWSGGSMFEPRRATGQPYRGINVLLLWASAERHGFSSPHWFTFKQALEAGGHVRKGEKSTRIVFFKRLEIREQGEGGEDATRSVPLLRTYAVFNADQCEGLPAKYQPAPVELVAGKERDAAAEAALRSSGAEIREGQGGAFYVPAQDYIGMPAFDRFNTTGDFLSTLAHELCHWTGHKSRLDRFDKQDRTAYAFEELVAEIGAAFVNARLGIVGDHVESHAAYLSHWLKVLRDDKRAIFRAAALAQSAADMVLANAGPAYAREPEQLTEAA